MRSTPTSTAVERPAISTQRSTPMPNEPGAGATELTSQAMAIEITSGPTNTSARMQRAAHGRAIHSDAEFRPAGSMFPAALSSVALGRDQCLVHRSQNGRT